MKILKVLKEELGIKLEQVEAAVKLIDEGNTIPFIARYRKEVTGSLDDEQLRRLLERLNYLRNLEDRKEQVIKTIEEQGKLTEELKAEIFKAETLVVIEDLYRPYRQKRRTRATIAVEKGLENLAKLIMEEGNASIFEEAKKFLSEEKGVLSIEDAINGAKDIIAEEISDNAKLRMYIRNLSLERASITSKTKDETLESVYEMYYDFEEKIKGIAGHRVLALNRGEKEKILTVKVIFPDEEILTYIKKEIISGDSEASAIIGESIDDSYKRLITPSIEREIRNELTQSAEDGAIEVFGKNLEQLLMQPPVAGQVVLGWDPAFRTGCKLAIVDATGKVLDTKVIFPTAPQNKIEESKKIIKDFIKKYKVTLISIGNGTASRESEEFVADLLREIEEPVKYIIVNEAGASVYSASKLATEEFPDYDVGERSAASIARRLQDPLAELVKIDPQSIGVGQYQHDMNQKNLSEALSGVVEGSVNKVGVDLNTASAPLLEHISGINKTVAKNIVSYREEQGSFKNRKQLLKVPKLGPKAFEQSAGFMRIAQGDNPLDNTGVHPESYKVAEKLLKTLGLSVEDIRQSPECKGEDYINISSRTKDVSKMAEELSVGEITLKDIIKELEKPGRDPRDEMPKPILRSDVLDMEDLVEGMILKGTVRNVIDFGAFVDIGVHQDGLVHISQLTNKKFVKHPLEVVSVGDVVEVKIMSVDVGRKRIQLTMII